MIEAKSVDFLGLEFQPQPTAEFAATLAEAASVDTPFAYVVTPNVDHMVRLEQHPELLELYTNAGWCVNDSRILEVLAKRSKVYLPASPGADVVALLFETYISPDEPVNVIGGTPDVIKAVKARYGLTRLNWHDAPMGLAKNPAAVDACAEFIAAHPARFTFLCVGSPQQEMVALATLRHGGAKGVGLCCGASLDFLAGKVARAPGWMRRSRLEWLHRLASQPGRLGRRYLVDGPRIFRIWSRWTRIKKRGA